MSSQKKPWHAFRAVVFSHFTTFANTNIVIDVGGESGLVGETKSLYQEAVHQKFLALMQKNMDTEQFTTTAKMLEKRIVPKFVDTAISYKENETENTSQVNQDLESSNVSGERTYRNLIAKQFTSSELSSSNKFTSQVNELVDQKANDIANIQASDKDDAHNNSNSQTSNQSEEYQKLKSLVAENLYFVGKSAKSSTGNMPLGYVPRLAELTTSTTKLILKQYLQHKSFQEKVKLANGVNTKDLISLFIRNNLQSTLDILHSQGAFVAKTNYQLIPAARSITGLSSLVSAFYKKQAVAHSFVLNSTYSSGTISNNAFSNESASNGSVTENYLANNALANNNSVVNISQHLTDVANYLLLQDAEQEFKLSFLNSRLYQKTPSSNDDSFVIQPVNYTNVKLGNFQPNYLLNSIYVKQQDIVLRNTKDNDVKSIEKRLNSTNSKNSIKIRNLTKSSNLALSKENSGAQISGSGFYDAKDGKIASLYGTTSAVYPFSKRAFLHMQQLEAMASDKVESSYTVQVTGAKVPMLPLMLPISRSSKVKGSEAVIYDTPDNLFLRNGYYIKLLGMPLNCIGLYSDDFKNRITTRNISKTFRIYNDEKHANRRIIQIWRYNLDNVFEDAELVCAKDILVPVTRKLSPEVFTDIILTDFAKYLPADMVALLLRKQQKLYPHVVLNSNTIDHRYDIQGEQKLRSLVQQRWQRLIVPDLLNLRNKSQWLLYHSYSDSNHNVFTNEILLNNQLNLRLPPVPSPQEIEQLRDGVPGSLSLLRAGFNAGLSLKGPQPHAPLFDEVEINMLVDGIDGAGYNPTNHLSNAGLSFSNRLSYVDYHEHVNLLKFLGLLNLSNLVQTSELDYLDKLLANPYMDTPAEVAKVFLTLGYKYQMLIVYDNQQLRDPQLVANFKRLSNQILRFFVYNRNIPLVEQLLSQIQIAFPTLNIMEAPELPVFDKFLKEAVSQLPDGDPAILWGNYLIALDSIYVTNSTL